MAIGFPVGRRSGQLDTETDEEGDDKPGRDDVSKLISACRWPCASVTVILGSGGVILESY